MIFRSLIAFLGIAQLHGIFKHVLVKDLHLHDLQYNLLVLQRTIRSGWQRGRQSEGRVCGWICVQGIAVDRTGCLRAPNPHHKAKAARPPPLTDYGFGWPTGGIPG